MRTGVGLDRFAVALVALAAAAVWLPTVRHHLLFCDDLGWGLSSVERVEQGKLLEVRPYFRPVAEGVFYLLWQVFGWHSFGWRTVMLGLHALGGWLTWQIAAGLRFPRWVAAGATALFLLSHVHRETVLWTTGLIHVIGGVGALACLAFLIRGWLWGRRAGVVVAIHAAATFAYPSLVLLPALAYGAWRVWHRERPRPDGLLVGTAAVAAAWVTLEFIAPTVLRGGRYPHLDEVSLDAAFAAVNALRNFAGGCLYAWFPAAPLERMSGPMAAAVKLAAGALTLGAAARVWRTGAPGRWLLGCAAASLVPFIFRIYVDSRMLYVTSAVMGLVLAAAAGTFRGFAAGLAASVLALTVGLNSWNLVRFSRAHRLAGEEVARILETVRREAPRHRPGGLVVFRGFPNWIGTGPWSAPLFLYPPWEPLRLLLGDPGVQPVFLRPGEAPPAPRGRSVILVDRQPEEAR